jgi:predicted DNA-binding mobile mystery protein A
LVNQATPPAGWINTIRTALGMSLRQLADRLGKKPQTIKKLEKSEENSTITLQSLKEIAEALDMKLIYALVPKQNDLADLVAKKAEEKAKDIVNRSEITMSLEDQEIGRARVMDAYTQKKNELINEMPKFLWD